MHVAADDEPEETMAEQRERLQLELLKILHSDGAALTRRSDTTPPKSRILQEAVPFVVGLLLGALSAFGLVTGRITTLEADNRHGIEWIAEQKRQNEKTTESVQELTREIAALRLLLTTNKRDR